MGRKKTATTKQGPKSLWRFWVFLPSLIVVLLVLGLHQWHPAVPVEMELESRFAQLSLTASPASQPLLGKGLGFERLSLQGFESLSFIPAVKQYLADRSPQADLALPSKGLLAGLDLPVGATFNLASPAAKTLRLNLPGNLTLHIQPDRTHPPKLLLRNLRDVAELDLAWPQAADKLYLALYPHAGLSLTVPEQEDLDLLDGPPLPLAKLVLARLGEGSERVGTLESGKLRFPEDSKLDEKSLSPAQAVVVNAGASLQLTRLRLDAKRGVLLLRLRGEAASLTADDQDLRPSALERLWNRPWLAILFAVLVGVFPATLAVRQLYQESRNP